MTSSLIIISLLVIVVSFIILTLFQKEAIDTYKHIHRIHDEHLKKNSESPPCNKDLAEQANSKERLN